jgi:hypothetical protein
MIANCADSTKVERARVPEVTRRTSVNSRIGEVRLITQVNLVFGAKPQVCSALPSEEEGDCQERIENVLKAGPANRFLWACIT